MDKLILSDTESPQLTTARIPIKVDHPVTFTTFSVLTVAATSLLHTVGNVLHITVLVTSLFELWRSPIRTLYYCTLQCKYSKYSFTKLTFLFEMCG